MFDRLNFSKRHLANIVEWAKRELEIEDAPININTLTEIGADILSAKVQEDWDLCAKEIRSFLQRNSVLYGNLRKRGDEKTRRKLNLDEEDSQDAPEHHTQEEEDPDAPPDVDIDEFDDPVVDTNTLLQREEMNKQRKHILNLLTSLDSFALGTEDNIREEMSDYIEPLREQLEMALAAPEDLQGGSD